MGDSIIKKKSFEFALCVVRISRSLIDNREYVLSKQLLRSGTSIGANIREALNTQTRRDFIYKFSLSQKECDETLYWLELLFLSNLISKDDFDELFHEATGMLKMIRSIILTSRKRMGPVKL